jgi:P2 family phage contractile tail tube protein
MAGLWLDQNLTVNANSVYANSIGGKQEMVGKNVEVSLPEVKSKTVDAEAMGTLTVPVIGQLENMEMSIHHIGADHGLSKMLAQETMELEIRWIDQVMKDNGTQVTVGCKAFITANPQVAVPQISVKPGEAIDVEVTYTVTAYKLVRDGEVLWDINRLAGKYIIGGKDYYADITSML